MRSRDRSRLTGGPGGDVRLLTTLSGTLEKGGPGFILEFTNKVHGNLGHDKVQSYFINSSPPQSRIWSTWYRRKTMIEKNPTAQVARSLMENSSRTSGFTEGLINWP